jgi:calcium/calmodulin-dependent protein kinase (CaM kinase) II
LNHSASDQEILALNQAMLESVARGDWNSYASYCDPSLSCFEAETNGILAEGLAFHRFYFSNEDSESSIENNGKNCSVNVNMARPHLRWLSDTAVVLSYTRLTQRRLVDEAITNSCCETRIWQKLEGAWKQVHVHRS